MSEDDTARAPAAASQGEDVLLQCSRWRDQGMNVALATVIATWGSAPRAAGSHMAVNERGEFVGSVSGGCVEGAVIHVAKEVMATGEPRRIEYGVANELAWEVGLACGGRIAIYVEPVQ